jgi:hypothetical protein
MMILTDDQTDDPKGMPTRANILNGFRWLRNGAQAGDSLILHYSGHGGSVEDTDGDEEVRLTFIHIFPKRESFTNTIIIVIRMEWTKHFVLWTMLQVE